MTKPGFVATRALGAMAKSYSLGAAVLTLSVALSSCSGGRYNDYDLKGNITKKQYEDLEGRRAPTPQARGEEPPIPNFQSVLAAPAAPELADTRRVSIAVTETVPVRDVLLELARKADVDLELDPRISGGIIMTATDRPFADVISRIADLAELRYKFEKNTLRVEIDDPYLEQYRMDVLNVQRMGSSSTSSSTDASSVSQAIGAGGGGGGGSNKSASSISSTTTSDFWKDVGQNINEILTNIKSRRGAAAANTQIQASYVPEAAAPAAPAAPPAGGQGGGGGAAPAPAGAAGSALNQAASLGNRQAQLDANIAQDQPKPPVLGAGGDKAGAPLQVVPQSEYSLNPLAGIITVFATQRQQKAIERYLRDVRASVTQQVLIEAKVLEITLNDNFRSGVDWNAILGPNSNTQNFNLSTNFGQNLPSNLLTPDIAGTWTGAILSPNGRNNLSVAAQLISQFGTVRTLSSPRLTVLNNQMAQLKVADNQVFFELTVNITQGTATTPPLTTVTSNIKTVPVGLIMNVQPAIDPTTKRISLGLHPAITRITGFVNDPGVSVAIAVAQQNNPNSKVPTVTSAIPIIEVREMDSVVDMDSGQTMVMGGLMQEQAQTNREGVPGLMDVPVLGMAAGENTRQNVTSELVIFLRATLVNGPGTVTDEDIRLYKTFTPDPRPVVF